ncbi:MAG TPA: hypothetical protein VNJ01_08700 [Bacteriovoracaceae bacterium]|nr:hypothetical protein [Bacteriovoracaceae bacterium]
MKLSIIFSVFSALLISLSVKSQSCFGPYEVKQITNQNNPNILKKVPFIGDSFADSAPPRFEIDGSVSLYGSGSDYLKFPLKNGLPGIHSLITGGRPTIESFKMSHPDGTLLKPLELVEVPWDVTLETWPKWNHVKIMYGGVMTPPKGQLNARWPVDNIGRRVYAFKLVNGIWRREKTPLTYPLTDNWIGHSYGHHFISDENGKTWMFYDRVSEQKNNQPWKTEIFAKELISPTRTSSKEHKIIGISAKPYPAQIRHFGGSLVEGPRPFAISVAGKKVYVISFSSGDFATNHYSINLAWSKKLLGPYQLVLNSAGSDLEDFGYHLRKGNHFGWGPSRAAFFQYKDQWYTLFQAVRTRLWPMQDFETWPSNWEGGIYRDIFLSQANFFWSNDSGAESLSVCLGGSIR